MSNIYEDDITIRMLHEAYKIYCDIIDHNDLYDIEEKALQKLKANDRLNANFTSMGVGWTPSMKRFYIINKLDCMKGIIEGDKLDDTENQNVLSSIIEWSSTFLCEESYETVIIMMNSGLESKQLVAEGIVYLSWFGLLIFDSIIRYSEIEPGFLDFLDIKEPYTHFSLSFALNDWWNRIVNVYIPKLIDTTTNHEIGGLWIKPTITVSPYGDINIYDCTLVDFTRWIPNQS